MNKRIKSRFGLTVSLVIFVFCVMLAGMILAGLLVMILHLTGILNFGMIAEEARTPEQVGHFVPLRIIFSMMVFSTFIGTPIAAFFSKKALKPIRKVVDATHEVAQGNYDVRVDIQGIHELEELSHSFNKMAHELSTVETLRGDFINNFSHEFKTPIVSVRGFAKLLRDGDLSEDEKREYLNIIIMESERLASLSTNVLNLSKYENIGIVHDKSEFRLDEQIRRSIALTEAKWSAKNIDIDVEMEEIILESSEDLTQQIWLNLLDNAIKFSEQGGKIVVRLNNWNGGIRFTIEDNGIGMNAETSERVFDKFYQGDDSHTKAGNGLGLSIVKRIVELCGGEIEIHSEIDKGTMFKISLPLNEK